MFLRKKFKKIEKKKKKKKGKRKSKERYRFLLSEIGPATMSRIATTWKIKINPLINRKGDLNIF
jgi:hypothetical protein